MDIDEIRCLEQEEMKKSFELGFDFANFHGDYSGCYRVGRRFGEAVSNVGCYVSLEGGNVPDESLPGFCTNLVILRNLVDYYREDFPYGSFYGADDHIAYFSRVMKEDRVKERAADLLGEEFLGIFK